MRNRGLLVGLISAVVVLAIAVGILGWKLVAGEPSTKSAATPATAAPPTAGAGAAGSAAGEVPVRRVTVVEGSVPSPVRFTGNVTPYRDVTLVSKVSGTVAWTAGGMGTRVEAGGPVLRLDASELELALAQAEAGLAAAEANFARLEAGAAPEEIAQVEAAAEQARLALDRVAEALARQEELFAQGIIPEETLKGVRTEHDVAQLQYESARQQLILVRRGATREERDAVRAQARQAEVAVRLAEQQLADTVVRAPFAGLLATQPAEVGSLIGQGTPVAGLVDIDRVVVDANVGEREVNRIQVGDEVEVTVDALARSAAGGAARFVGVVDAIAPVADRQTGTFPVRFLVDNPDHELKPGMVARVGLELDAGDAGPVVPAAAIVTRGGEDFVFVPAATADGGIVARERRVRVGASAAGVTRLLDGVSLGDVVLVPDGGGALRDGARVRVVREDV